MSGRHLSSTSLSAYVDGETGPAEARRLELHLAACAGCRSRLASTRRLAGGLRRLAAVPPPAELAARVHSRIAAEPDAPAAAPAGPPGSRPSLRPFRRLPAWRRLRAMSSWIYWHDLPPLRGSWSAPAPLLSLGLMLLVTVLLLENGSGAGLAPLYPSLPRAHPEFLVSEVFGDAPAVLPQTTSEVAGRVFVWSDDVWVQRGVDPGGAGAPRAVPASSPAGRELLAKHADLGVLLADGSRVVLRYNYETLELWNGS